MKNPNFICRWFHKKYHERLDTWVYTAYWRCNKCRKLWVDFI